MQAPCIPNLFRNAVKARANNDFFALVDCLTQGTDYEIFAEDNLSKHRGPYEVLTWLMRQYTFDRNSIPEHKRILIELSMAKLAFQPNIASLFRAALKESKIGSIVRSHPLQKRFLLQSAAQNLGEHCAASPPSAEKETNKVNIYSTGVNYYDGLWNETERNELLSLIYDLVVAGTDLHWLNFFLRTPLLSIFVWYVQFGNPYVPGDAYCRVFSGTQTTHIQDLSAKLLVPMRLWLKQLKKGGVDLEEYGRKEQYLQHMHENSEQIATECFYVWYGKRNKQMTRN